MRNTALILSLLATTACPAVAQDLLDGAGFDALTEGRTLTYFIDGEAYGIEAYLPDRQVIWRRLGEPCQYGEWFAEGPRICFVYDDVPGVEHCFSYVAEGRGLREVPDTPGDPLVTAEEDGRPLTCAGFGV